MEHTGDDALAERLKKLAREKSYLQLTIQLMNRVRSAAGLEDAIGDVLTGILESIGGTNAILYYFTDDGIFRVEAMGERRKIPEVEDPGVRAVLESRRPVTVRTGLESAKLTPPFQAAWTWYVPLVVSDEVLGAMKLCDMPISFQELDYVIPTLFSYVAMTLKGALAGHARLREAYSRLSEAHTALAARSVQLEAAILELESFSYSVSHDLRTPLRAIDGFSKLLLDDYGEALDEEGRRMLEVVRDNTIRMSQLIDDILSFSRMGRQGMKETDLDLERLAREVFEELRITNADRTVRLVVGPLPPARGDRSMMRQVLINLLSNAIKFTRPRPEAVVEVGGAVEAAEVHYWVKDNGVGFEMQYASKLFGVFERLHPSREFEGTGIGLAIVKRVITRQGGRVWVEGKVDEGATVHFTLPRRDPFGEARGP